MIVPFKERTINPNKPVKVYRNLNNSLLSVMQGSQVVGHAPEIDLDDVTFHVQKAGLERCRETHVKNVHAYVKGFIRQDTVDADKENRIRYNPYIFDTFVDRNEQPIQKARAIHIDREGQMLYKEA